MPTRYEVFIRREVHLTLVALPKTARKKIARAIESLHEDPFQSGNATIESPSGRLLHIMTIGNHAFHYWVDHVEKEARVIDLKRI